MAELETDRPAEAVIETPPDPTGVPLVKVSGEVDISNADELAATVSAITSTSPKRIVFDLNGLRFMDSAGIAVLLGAAAKVEQVGVRNPSPAVRRVVELTGLTDVLSIEP
jgi:anti-anti-sigma factor